MAEGKVILITGGAGLLGRAFAAALLRAGGRVVIGDIQTEATAQALESLRAAEGPDARIDAVELDIGSETSVKQSLEVITARYGRIDAVINNAYPRNKNYGKSFFQVAYDDFCENVSANLGGYFLVSRVYSEHFVKQGTGQIINIASIYGVMAPRFAIYRDTPMTMPVEYAAIKSGVIHLTKYMAQLLKGTGVRVNAISPGGILDKQPESFLRHYNELCSSKGMLDPGDVAGVLVFLLSDAAAYINGQNLIVDDGFSL